VTESVRIVRSPPGLVWRAFDGDQAVGAVRATLRPNQRWFVFFDTCREDSYAPLVAAVAQNTCADLYTIMDEANEEGLARLSRLGFAEDRREGIFVIPTDPAATGLRDVAVPDEITIISASNAYEDQLRLLDEDLRQDVPGAEGWQWDPGDFNEETFDSGFDPETYLVAVEWASGEYIGLVRIWDNPGRPRLGLIALRRGWRRRGLARALLSQAFRVLHDRGKAEVSAEADDANLASVALLTSIGGKRHRGYAELVRRAPGGAG
jgi:ribosomal protein S18 acetylase RimI-like enzyme